MSHLIENEGKLVMQCPAVVQAIFCSIATVVGSAALTLAAEEPSTPAPQPPAWTQTTREPLWNFVCVADLHLDGSRLQYAAEAFHYIDAELKPRFVVFLGDNNAQPADPSDAAHPESIGLRRQNFFKDYLQKHLQSPYVLVSGDDWPEDSDKVFGPRQFSFDQGGVHFILVDPDRVYHGPGFEGLSAFDKGTWQWIARDLETNRERPTLLAIHEPIFPATFVDAKRLRELVARYPNVVAVLQAHLHGDIEHRIAGRSYFVVPSLGKTPTQAMKHVLVQPEGLVIRTIAYNPSSRTFEMSNRIQWVEIGKPWRTSLARPSGSFKPEHHSFVPAHPLVIDPRLTLRMGELIGNAPDLLRVKDDP